MSKTLLAAGAALAALAAAPAAAAIPGIAVTGSPAISESPVSVSLFADSLFVSGLEAGAGTGFAMDPTGLTTGVSADFFLGEGEVAVDDVLATEPSVLFSTMLVSFAGLGDAADNGTDTIELLFSGPTGSAAAAFGSLLLVTLTGEFGADPLSAAVDDPAASLRIQPASFASAVPLPAGLPLLLSGLAGLALAARARRA